jgi:hypothetical protein
MARVTAALLHNNNSSRHRTILNPLAAKEAVVAAANGDSSNSAMAISVTLVSAATIVTMDDAGAINGDVADSVRRADRAAAEAVVVAAAEEDKSRHLGRRSLQ